MGAMNELYTELEEIKDRITLMVCKDNELDRHELACDICDRISNMVTGFLASYTPDTKIKDEVAYLKEVIELHEAMEFVLKERCNILISWLSMYTKFDFSPYEFSELKREEIANDQT